MPPMGMPPIVFRGTVWGAEDEIAPDDVHIAASTAAHGRAARRTERGPPAAAAIAKGGRVGPSRCAGGGRQPGSHFIEMRALR